MRQALRQPLAIDCDDVPVFVHSMWRSSSTYIFNIFRKSIADYRCFCESIHEIFLICRENPNGLLEASADKAGALRHPKLEEDYFYEAYHAHDYWAPFVSKQMIYDDFFATDISKSLEDFYRALMASSSGRPIFQECRTFGRMNSLKACLGGWHLYLLRNPWDQWWSLKINHYFDVVIQLTLNAEPHPPIVAAVRARNNFQAYHSADIGAEFEHFRQRPMSSQQSYRAFFALWASALLQAFESADIIIDVDRLSTSSSYQESTAHRLAAWGLDHLSFDDCQTPSLPFEAKERKFYEEIEAEIFEELLAGGADPRRVRGLQSLLKRKWRSCVQAASDNAEGLANTRAIVLRHADELRGMVESLHVAEARREEAAHAHQGVVSILKQQLAVFGETARRAHRERIEAQHKAAQSRNAENEALCTAHALRAEISGRDEVIDQLVIDAQELERSVQRAAEALLKLRTSMSWRATAPFRYVGRRIRRLFKR